VKNIILTVTMVLGLAVVAAGNGGLLSLTGASIDVAGGEISAADGAVVLDADGITAIAGTIGGWTLGSTSLSGGTVTLNANGTVTLGSSGSVSAGYWTADDDGIRITPTTGIDDTRRYGFYNTGAGMGYNTSSTYLELSAGSGSAVQVTGNGFGFYFGSPGLTAAPGNRKLGDGSYPWEINGATGGSASGTCDSGSPYATFSISNWIVESFGCTSAPGPSLQQQIDALREEIAGLRVELGALQAAGARQR
jgi:hypothetical protein